LVVPSEGWMHVGWQTAVGWIGALFVVLGVRRAQAPAKLTWYLFAAAIALNAAGVTIEEFLERVFHDSASPSVADIFWFALYPGLLIGLASIIYKRSAGESPSALMRSSIMSVLFTLGLGLFAWDSVIWQQQS